MRKLLLAAFSLCFTMLLGELVLRLTWDDYYVRQTRDNVEFHTTRGWANRPSWLVDFGKPEYRFVAHQNALGLRGPEVPERTPPGRVRVLAVGDSMTYGLGVEDGETFASQLEASDPRLEVLNAGVPGYSTVEELLLLREIGLGLHPDVVLLMFLPNDIPGGLRSTYSHVTLESDGVRIEPPPTGSPDHPNLREKRVRHPTLSKSYLYRFVSDRLKLLEYRVSDALSIPIYDVDHLRPEEIEPAWRQERALLREFKRDVEASGAQLLLVVIPEPAQVETEMPVNGIDPAAFQVQERLRAIAADEGIRMFDLLPGLRAAHEREQRPLHYRYDRHWNANGHRATAQLLAPELENLLQERPPLEGARLPAGAATSAADSSGR